MALKKIKEFIKKQKLESKIDELVKERMGEMHIESYIFTEKRIQEWARWCCSAQCLDLVNQGHNTKGQINPLVKKMQKEFFAQLKFEFRNRPDFVLMPLSQGDPGLEITQFVRGTTFQPSKESINTGSKLIRNKIGFAKEAGLQAVPVLKKGGTYLREQSKGSEKHRLGHAMTQGKSALHGHHGGSGADIKLEAGEIIPPTTAGGVIARDRVKNDLINPHTFLGDGFTERTPEDMKDDAIQLSKDEILFDIVASSLLDWFDHQLRIDRTPYTNLEDGVTYTFVEDIVYVDFALGDGPVGKANTAYRNKWDANKTDGVTQRINEALDDISESIEEYVINEGLQNQGNLAALQMSPSSVDNVTSVGTNMVINEVVRKLPKNKVTKSLVAPLIPKKRNYKHPIKKSRVSAAVLINKGKKHGRRIPKSSKNTSSNPRPNVVGLKEILNQQLPEKLLANMGSPALNNQTGRFRHSANVTNIVVGPRGGTEIQYTYRKDPYKMYEPGGERGSTARDPRRLIGGTIREMASEIMKNKFIKIRSV